MTCWCVCASSWSNLECHYVLLIDEGCKPHFLQWSGQSSYHHAWLIWQVYIWHLDHWCPVLEVIHITTHTHHYINKIEYKVPWYIGRKPNPKTLNLLVTKGWECHFKFKVQGLGFLYNMPWDQLIRLFFIKITHLLKKIDNKAPNLL